jgi:ATP-dependent helicase/DNAse subunit B
LFLGGLNEGSFPRTRHEDCFYNEAERQQLNNHGLALGHRSSQSQDELLLFYGVATRARKSLVLTYPAMNASGQPLFPSPYVVAVQDLFEPDALDVEHAANLDPVPPLDRVLSAADLR